MTDTKLTNPIRKYANPVVESLYFVLNNWESLAKAYPNEFPSILCERCRSGYSVLCRTSIQEFVGSLIDLPNNH